MLHYLNVTVTTRAIIIFGIGLSTPSAIAAQLFYRSLGVKYDTDFPASSSKPLGYVHETVDPRTGDIKIRQVIHTVNQRSE